MDEAKCGPSRAGAYGMCSKPAATSNTVGKDGHVEFHVFPFFIKIAVPYSLFDYVSFAPGGLPRDNGGRIP